MSVGVMVDQKTEIEPISLKRIHPINKSGNPVYAFNNGRTFLEVRPSGKKDVELQVTFDGSEVSSPLVLPKERMLTDRWKKKVHDYLQSKQLGDFALSDQSIEGLLLSFKDMLALLKERNQPPDYTPEIDDVSLATLQRLDLFNYTMGEIGKQVVGEEDTISTIFLCANGRFVENNNTASYNMLVDSASGSGKDYVVGTTLNSIMPKDQYIKRTRISEKVFNYWHNALYEPEWSWDGKVFYNEDISNNVLASDAFKVMASSGSYITVLIDQAPVDIEIKGKPVMMVTLATVHPNKEVFRRFPPISLNETVSQTKAIMKKKADQARRGRNLDVDPNLKEAFSFLKRVKVRVPYADDLVDYFPPNHIVMRTHFDRFLDFIKASAALYQYQREKDEEGYLLATGQDYNIARIALLKTMSNPYMVPLTKDEQRIKSVFEKLPRKTYSISELEKYITFITPEWLRKLLDRSLVEYGFLSKDTERREGARGPKSVMVYSFNPLPDTTLPTWDELENCRKRSECSNYSDNRGCSDSLECSDNSINDNNVSNTSPTRKEDNGQNPEHSEHLTGVTEKIIDLRATVKILCRQSGRDTLPTDQLVSYLAEETGRPKEEIEKYLAHALNKGDLYEPAKGEIAVPL